MFKKYVCLFLGILAILSCTDETIVYEDPLVDNLKLENNEAALAKYTNFSIAGVVDLHGSAAISEKTSTTAKEPSAGDFPLTVVAQILPPVYNGAEVLTSTHIQVAGSYAYVSYNVAGEIYRGAVDIIDISSPANPILRSRLIYSNADINAVYFSEGYVYIAGGVDMETSTIATASSFVSKIEAFDGRFNLNNPPQYLFIDGDQANDITINNKALWVTNGTQGYLSKIDPDKFEIEEQYPLNDPRSVALFDNRIAVLEAGVGILILDNNLKLKSTIPITTDLGIQSKRSIDFQEDKIVVAESSKGSGVYDVNSGNLLEYLDIPVNPSNLESIDKVTNAVVFNEDVVLMANGGAGLSLSQKTKYGNYEHVGVMEFSDMGGSVNYVDTRNDYIIMASGNEGVQVIKFNRISKSLLQACEGLPEYNGSSKLFVREGEIKEYTGAKRLNRIDVDGALLLCGSWTVRNHVEIDKEGLFEVFGTLAVGNNRRERDVKVKKNTRLRIEGSLTIYGDLVLEQGATIEFIGANSVADIHGDVDIHENAQVLGSFEDVRGKF